MEMATLLGISALLLSLLPYNVHAELTPLATKKQYNTEQNKLAGNSHNKWSCLQ